ncbi:class I SAM-dependent methyltransferase [Microbispora triticiradicis]|uniref:class I SAM-dependent methyltransferase n=1 Tax=Microbispora triticiradicis TaxID=2200763 RepID=UPI001AD614A4|nr:class I SAM-dependent methyltransferase [Microbispora triticiradicis]MBO4269238.1 class I SAM-dependent methyltransferase [Microbispora triticiradicis]
MHNITREYQQEIWAKVSFPDGELERSRDLYHRFERDLKEAREQQRRLYANWVSKGLDPQVCDIEAELTYLRIRQSRPADVVEISSGSGWSTSWILRALADNGTGRLHSYDLVDDSVRNVPADLAADRWHFHQGDVRESTAALPESADYLFLDSDHSAQFAEWYLADVLPRFPRAQVSVHDIVKWPDEWGWGEESIVLCRWLAEQGIPCFTAARALPDVGFAGLTALRESLGISSLHWEDYNSMIFFSL